MIIPEISRSHGTSYNYPIKYPHKISLYILIITIPIIKVPIMEPTLILLLAIPIIVIHSPLVVGYFPGTGPTTIFIDKQIAHWEAMIFLHPQILKPPKNNR